MTSIDLKLVETLQLIVQEGGVAPAAGRLNLSQSTVSERIRTLEADLGVTLLARQGRVVRPTDAGHRLLAYAGRLLDLAEEARLAAQGSDAPSMLRIGIVESLLAYRLAPTLDALRSLRPGQRLEFVPGQSPTLVDAVGAGQIDLAFTIMPRAHKAGLVLHPLYPEPIVLLAGPGHRLAGSKTCLASDIADEPLLLTEAGCSYRAAVEASLRRQQVTPRHISGFSSVEAIKRSIEGGSGLAFLPRMAADQELASGRLVTLPWHDPQIALWSQLVVRRDQANHPAVGDFLSLFQLA